MRTNTCRRIHSLFCVLNFILPHADQIKKKILNGSGLSYGLDDPEFESRQEYNMFLSYNTSGSAVVPTQLPFQ